MKIISSNNHHNKMVRKIDEISRNFFNQDTTTNYIIVNKQIAEILQTIQKVNEVKNINSGSF